MHFELPFFVGLCGLWQNLTSGPRMPWVTHTHTHPTCWCCRLSWFPFFVLPFFFGFVWLLCPISNSLGYDFISFIVPRYPFYFASARRRLLPVRKFDILVIANCCMYSYNYFRCRLVSLGYCVCRNPLPLSFSISDLCLSLSLFLSLALFVSVAIELYLCLFMLFGKKRRCTQRCWLLASLFIVLAFNIVAPSIIYDARLKLAPHSQRACGQVLVVIVCPVINLCFFISSCHNFTLK